MRNESIAKLINDRYFKVLSVDATGKYTTVKSFEEEPTFDNIEEYWKWFINSELIHEEDKEKVGDFIYNQEENVIYRRMLNGSFRYVVMESVHLEDSYVLTIRDIDDIYSKELPFVVSKANRIDDMTGTLNRKAFDDDIHKPHKGNVGVAYIDINGLKWINDHKSHTDGDNLILASVKMLKEAFPAYNLYRIGGDEFVIIGFNVKIRVFLHMVIALHKRIWDGQPMFSIGYSADCSEDVDDVVIDAENQMYEDKQIFYRHFPEYKR